MLFRRTHVYPCDSDMSASKQQSLSSDDLRKRLYQTFKTRGVLDTLKTQLRTQLIQELQAPLARETLPIADAAQEHPVSILASNSLVIDHLQSCGYEYTLSVFYPESGMSNDKVFSTRDLCQFMKISPQSPLYKSQVSNIQKGQKGLLISFLSELSDHHIQAELRDADTQTPTAQSSGESLVRKLQMIDEEYEDLRQKGTRWASLEAKLGAYRKEMEEQSQAELKVKLQHFQEVEVARVQREEQDRCRRELMELTRSLEITYEQKAEALMSREKNAIERLQKQQEIEEKQIYHQRQTLLKEIEAVRSREQDLMHQVETFEKSCKAHEERVRSTEELLSRRELAVKTLEDTYEQKLNNEVRKHELELNEDYTRRTEKLTHDEKRNKEEMLRLQKEAAFLDSKAEEYSQNTSELQHAQAELESARAEVGMLMQQNALLKERLEGMSDLWALRTEHTELQAHVHLLQEQLQERQLEVQRLRRELSASSQEVLTLRVEVQRLEMAHRLHREELQKQQHVFHVQLTQEGEHCAQLNAQLLECEERTRKMAAHTEELRQQLRHTQQALENEVFRNPKPSLVNCCILDLSSNNVVPPDLYAEGASLKAHVSFDVGVCDPGLSGTGQRSLCPRGGAVEPSTERVLDALARIRELEKEAESLEEAYRTYQQRAARAGVAHIPCGALSPPCAPAPYITPVPSAPPRVTFPLNERAMPSFHVNKELTQAPLPKRTPPRVGSPPPRRLSSTPASTSKTRPRVYIAHDADMHPGSSSGDRPAVTFASLSPGRQVSPIPAATAESSGDYMHFTPPSSPLMKSTVGYRCRPLKLQKVLSTSSQESSPQPEKISIQDLTEPLPDLHCSSNMLQETQRITGLTHAPCSQRDSAPEDQREGDSAPEDQREGDSAPDDQREGDLSQGEDTMIPFSKAGKREEDEGDGEKRWQEDGRRKEERRCREREEAQEPERQEQEALGERGGVEGEWDVHCDGGPVKAGGDAAGADMLKGSPWGGGEANKQDPVVHTDTADPVVHTDTADPLHKYMMMVMQRRDGDKEQSPKKENSETQSLEPMMSEDKDNSIVTFSQDEADEFW